MNKITLLLLLIVLSTITLQAQFTSGNTTLSTTAGMEMSAKVDITSTEVTLTINGPSDRWFAIGFGGNAMSTVTDVFAFDGTGNYDKIGQNHAAPATDVNQDWTLVSETVSGAQRTIIATRALSTSDASDYTFNNAATTIPIIWARGRSASNTFAYHGERGFTTLNLTSTASVNEQQNIKFVMYPNPVNAELNLVIPSNIKTAQVEVYNILGKIVLSKKIETTYNTVNVANLNRGLYLIKIITDNNSYGVKQFIKR